MAPPDPPLHLRQQGLQVAQEVSLVPLLHEAGALLVPGAAQGRRFNMGTVVMEWVCLPENLVI